ncbi:MAG: hypothetical protein EBS89_02000 [Proteobacteria bacterium]|nr:hypothetical protein [Pseudomonadota bacterium]
MISLVTQWVRVFKVFRVYRAQQDLDCKVLKVLRVNLLVRVYKVLLVLVLKVCRVLKAQWALLISPQQKLLQHTLHFWVKQISLSLIILDMLRYLLMVFV